MALKILLNRTQRLFVFALAFLLALEFLSLVVVVYFARFALFIAYFLTILKYLSPVFLGAYALFLLVMFLAKGRELAVISWKEYFLETMRFAALSFILGTAFLLGCSLLGTIVAFLHSQLSSVPVVHQTVEELRLWVQAQFY
jgi:hypothetical protein